MYRAIDFAALVTKSYIAKDLEHERPLFIISMTTFLDELRPFSHINAVERGFTMKRVVS